MRLPNRSWVRSFGGFSFASNPERIARAEPANAPDLGDPVLGPVAALAAQRLGQHAVGGEGVVVLERGRLVGDLVGCGGAGVLKR